MRWRQFSLVHLTFQGPTGEQLLLNDEPQVLRRLANSTGEYLRSLQRFAHCTFVAMPHNDWLVPFCTASVTPQHMHPEPDDNHPPFAVARSSLPSHWHVHTAYLSAM